MKSKDERVIPVVSAACLAACLVLNVSCFLNTDGTAEPPPVWEDPDNDTIPSHLDNCDDVPNLTQADLDENGIGDACQDGAETSDVDEDGIWDKFDFCESPYPSDVFSTGAANTDCLGDAYINGTTCSIDFEPLIDHCDNCPVILNGEQLNDDADDIGNACEDLNNHGLLKVRMTRNTAFEAHQIGVHQDFSDSWMERFLRNDWALTNMGWSEGEINFEGTDAGTGIVPGRYEERLYSTENHGVMVMLQFNENMSNIATAGREATAGVIMRIAYEGAEAKSWVYCGIGKSDAGSDMLIIKEKPDGCSGDDCDHGIERARNESLDIPMEGTENGKPFYVLQAVKERNRVTCYLRSRIYHGNYDEDVLGEVSWNISPLSHSYVGIRADGVSVIYRAAVLFRD